MKKVGIVIGHNERSKGAYSPFLKLSEFDYWKKVAIEISNLDPSIDIYTRKFSNNYTSEMKTVISEINRHVYDYILEVHFNSSINSSACGCEVLFHKGNKYTNELSKAFLETVSKKYGIKIRGTIEISNSKERGGYGICNTKPNYILIEPFFGSNEQECEKFKDIKEMAKFIVDFIRS